MRINKLLFVVAMLLTPIGCLAKVLIDGFVYNLNSDGTAEVSCLDDGWYNEYYQRGDIIIPSIISYDGETYSVTSIGDAAFYYCRSLTSVEIPPSVTKIGDRAFEDCFDLTSVSIPNPVSTIGDAAFSGCRNLTSIDIPNSVTLIGDMAFYYCRSLTSLTIGNSVTSIGSSAFNDCSGLTSVEIPNSVTSIGGSAFANCSGLTSVTIGNSVTSIGDAAFANCSGLTSIEIPNSVTYIGNSAFANTGLTSVTIPNSVISIGSSAFNRCEGLTSVTIGNSVTSIGSTAFAWCTGLKSLTIPNSVTYIGKGAFDVIEFENFSLEDGVDELSCDVLEIRENNLYIGRTVRGSATFSRFKSLEIGAFVEFISPNMFRNAALTSLIINPGSDIVIEDGTFSGASNLVDITLPEDIAIIGDEAFSGTGIKSITIPGGVIGAKAFADCNLANIILGAEVESIGEKAFDGSYAIKNVYATPTTPPSAQDDTFGYYRAQLWVPQEAVETYNNVAYCWYRFKGTPLVCPENIEVSGPTGINGKPGETFRLTATITPANVTLDRVLWRSTNPAVATVDNDGLVTIRNLGTSGETKTRAAEDGSCQIIASTLYEDSPVAIVNIETSTSSIEYLNSDEMNVGGQSAYRENDIYTLQGVCVKRQASQEDIDALTPGIYIICNKKVIVR